MRSILRGFVVAAVVGAALVVVTPSATAHGAGTIIVPQQLSGRPAPILDGQCDADYRRGYNSRRLLYQPRYNFGAATFSLITTDRDLWVCITGLSRVPPNSTTQPYVSLVFDPDHSASTAPDAGDKALALSEDGHLTEYRGNGVGFVPIRGRGNWSAYTDTGTEIQWNAEFRVALSNIGNPGPGSVVGFQIRHNALLSTNDYFPWPSDSTRNNPPTWGDLFFLGAPSSPPGTMALADSRITQGMNWDIAQGANVPYDFVAGKDAMVEGHLYTTGAIADLASSSCGVQEIWPIAGPARTLPTDPSNHPHVFGTPTTALGAPGALRCWIPGSLVRDAGIYRFTVTAQMTGGSVQTFDIGVRSALNTRAVRLMIYRWAFPAGDPEHRIWDDTLNASAMDAMQDLQRVLPESSGVGRYAFSGTPAPDAPGVRYFFSPTIYQCVIGSGETDDDAKARCDATTRNNGDLERMVYDQQSARADALDGLHRDRIDLQEVLVSTPFSRGGQSCWSNSASAGSGLDSLSNGESHFVPIQESQHCWGELRSSSPHSIPTNRMHSVNTFVPVAAGQSAINTQTQQSLPNPRGVMSPEFGSEDHMTFTNEGVEFNDLRSTLLGLRPPSGPAAPSASRKIGNRQFQIAFLMDHRSNPDGITLQVAQRLSDSYLTPTKSAPNSRFSLVFRNGGGSVVKSLPFAVTTEGTHDGPIPIEGQVLLATLPGTATSVDIEEKDNPTPLFEEKFTAAAPSVDSLSATPNGGNDIDLSWKGSDPDSSDLRYNVYFAAHPGGVNTLIASGLTDNAYTFDTSFAPGTANGVFKVEASDGFNTGSATVGKIHIDTKKPDVVIDSPGADAVFVAGGSAQLSGAGYDPNTMQLLGSKNLSWSLDGSAVGTGTSLTLSKLAVGDHSLSLTGTTPAGTSDTTSVKFSVVADSDRDGIPNSVEITFSCLNPKVFDSSDDTDADGLSNYAEWQYSTDPCNPDTDTDGTSDGDEVEQSGDPTNGKIQPLPAKIYVPTESVDLGSCADPKPADIPVDQLKASTWTATPDERWVKVSGGGKGSGFVHVEPNCTDIAPGYTYDAHVGIEATTGQYREVEVSFTS